MMNMMMNAPYIDVLMPLFLGGKHEARDQAIEDYPQVILFIAMENGSLMLWLPSGELT